MPLINLICELTNIMKNKLIGCGREQSEVKSQKVIAEGDSCNCGGRSGRGCKGPSKISQQTWYPVCDQHKVRRRCQSEGLYQEGDPLKELNWCCDRGCVLSNRSQKCSQIKKTDLEMNEKKMSCIDDTAMDEDNSFLGHGKKVHSKCSEGKLDNELGNQYGIYTQDSNAEHEARRYSRTPKPSDLSLDKCKLYGSHQEKSNELKYLPGGDFHHAKEPSLDVVEKNKTSSEIRERYFTEMEILRSKLNLLKNEMVGDGKRLRQRSESEPGFAELSGGVPKRARDISPKMKLGCRKLPVQPAAHQTHQAQHRLTVKQNTPFRRESKSLSPSAVKTCDKVGFHLGSSFSKTYFQARQYIKDLCVNESDEDQEGSTCGEDLHARDDADTFSDDDGSVQSSLTSASSDSNTPSKVGESLGSITLSEIPKKTESDCGACPDSVPGNEQNGHPIISLENGHLFRSSLFPNVPPYVKFFMHDLKGPALPADIRKHLKWKLSSITPIVIRRTLLNSGFKLVRRSYEQYYRLIYISPHRREGVDPPFPCSSRICKKIPKESNEWTGQWGKHMKSFVFKTLKDFQKLNHFPGTFQIGRKDRLWKNLYRLMVKFGKKEFGFIPKTYILPHDRKLLKTAWEKFSGPGKGQWIVKPPAAARGTGIKVVHKWGQIPKKPPSLIVQKYIAQPYLINGSKFDLRLYVLMTSIHPLRIYLYDDGLVRFASVKYSDSVKCLSNRFMHLTNYSINKLSTQYQVNADATSCNGHKWSLKSLWTYLAKEGVNVKALKRNLVDLVIKTVISGESNINILSKNNLPSRYCSYELFGIDVLLDHALKPWLLEVNISPSLHSASPLDLAVKGPLVKELLNIAGFQIPAKLTKDQEEAFLETYGIKDRTHTLCYDRRLFWTTLSKEEKAKQESFLNVSRKQYLKTILEELTPDDVRHLIQFEDELTQINRFEKIFPTTQTHAYHQFFESPRYYNMLLDAWETRQQSNRWQGIQLLASLCEEKVHLKVALPGGKAQFSPSPNDPNSQAFLEAESESEAEAEREEAEEPEDEKKENPEPSKSSSPIRTSPKAKSPLKPAVVSKPSVLAVHSPSRKAKPTMPSSPRSPSEAEASESHVPFKETCMKMLAEIRQNGLKFPAESKCEKLKQLPSCKLENSMSEGLSTAKSVLSPTKHMHNACIKMNTTS